MVCDMSIGKGKQGLDERDEMEGREGVILGRWGRYLGCRSCHVWLRFNALPGSSPYKCNKVGR